MAKKPTDYAIEEYRPYGILVSGHYTEQRPYYIHRPSGSIDWLLMYTHSGSGEIVINQKTMKCHEGEVVILLPGIPHHYGASSEEWSFTWVHFIPHPEWSSWLRLPGQADRFIHLPVHSLPEKHSLQEALERMLYYAGHSGMELNRRLALNALEQALLLLCAGCSEEQNQMDSRILDVMEYLRQSFREKPTLEELARISCLSRSRLSHLFKEQVGDTIGNTLNKLRLEKAAELLLYTKRQISEISEDVGYESNDHLTRMFRSHFGVTPLKYRQQKRN
ncbi:helix-turn-helix domain-containing protein [Paenibacillus donghaensis]|uniref:HTH araC/xylS-type domain-containing protein n=1 Tax=Paenibacillus donghaensis TaxID=414771 RepID=A0A2Z2KPN1_9BACL|nr:helix-turn-helix domain-containing protein [Paenibacillus donghaensis]ASA20748.1 hypothetical protein B9T62_08090 [Paenibacillus donghaensis]